MPCQLPGIQVVRFNRQPKLPTNLTESSVFQFPTRARQNQLPELPETMASTLRFLAIMLLLFTFITAVVTAVEDDELESMLPVLRARSYNLFSNAISTSDLIYEVLSGKSFTFFAPTDSSLFTLDMTNTATDYISTLRCHVIPFRVSLDELRRRSRLGSSLPTLIENHRVTIRVERRSSMTASDDFITVDGVDVVLPGLFYSSNLAVHGLRGILNCTSDQESQTDSSRGKTYPSPRESPVIHSHAHPLPSDFSPPIDSQSSENAHNPKAPSPSPANLPYYHDFNSPVVTESQAQPSPSDFSNHIESPSSNDVHGSTIASPNPEPPVTRRFSPANAPPPDNFPPQISPAYDLWLEVPTSPHFAPSNEPEPPPEFSENYDPMAFPPSTAHAVEIHGAHMVATDSELNSLKKNDFSLIDENEQKSAVSEHIPVSSPEDMAMGRGNFSRQMRLPLVAQ